MSKHTPGPWRFSGDSVWSGNGHIASTWSPRVVSEDREDGESWLDMRNRTQPERDAIKLEKQDNTRLIAAAPELLDALSSAISQMDMAGDCIEAGRYDEALLHVRSLMAGRRAAIAKAAGERE